MQNRPIYIKIEDFDEVSKKVSEIRTKTDRVKAKLQELKEVKAKEDENIQDWESRINRLLQKVSSVESSLSSKR